MCALLVFVSFSRGRLDDSRVEIEEKFVFMVNRVFDSLANVEFISSHSKFLLLSHLHTHFQPSFHVDMSFIILDPLTSIDVRTKFFKKVWSINIIHLDEILIVAQLNDNFAYKQEFAKK